MKYFISAVFIVVLGAVVAAFFFVGTPAAERDRQFDERRVSDIQYITDTITSYWRIHKTVPEKLSDIKDFTAPVDPVTHIEYEYNRSGNLTYAICATFSGSNISQEPGAYPKAAYPYPYYDSNTWNHEAGRVCFDQEIHPELLQPPLAP